MSLSNVQVTVMTALVSFDRVFEVLDLKPLIDERPDAVPLPAASSATGSGLRARDRVRRTCRSATRRPARSRWPRWSRSRCPAHRAGQRRPAILHDVSFRAAPGKLTALVGPSGAGKTTITHLVSRLYDAGLGNGQDRRRTTSATSPWTRCTRPIGVVTQDAHLFHDTIRANLAYARPDATERELSWPARRPRSGS